MNKKNSAITINIKLDIEHSKIFLKYGTMAIFIKYIIVDKSSK
jgi:hypothetical protein